MENNFVPEVFLSEKFGELRIIEIDGKPYFCGTDVSKALGYSNPRDAIGRHCRVDGVVKRDTVNREFRVSISHFQSGAQCALPVYTQSCFSSHIYNRRDT